METGKWIPLIYLDEIKERNKPVNLEETKVKIPFFLDFNQVNDVKKNIIEELKDSIETKSKILKN